MNHILQPFGNHAEKRTVPALVPQAGAVRKPYPPECRECNGRGVTYGFGTNDPGEKEKSGECPRCNGEGWEPEPQQPEKTEER